MEQASSNLDQDQHHKMTKMNICSAIMQSIYHLQNAKTEYEKDFLVKGISLNFEYIGKLEFDYIQKEFLNSQQKKEEMKNEDKKNSEKV